MRATIRNILCTKTDYKQEDSKWYVTKRQTNPINEDKFEKLLSDTWNIKFKGYNMKRHSFSTPFGNKIVKVTLSNKDSKITYEFDFKQAFSSRFN